MAPVGDPSPPSLVLDLSAHRSISSSNAFAAAFLDYLLRWKFPETVALLGENAETLRPLVESLGENLDLAVAIHTVAAEVESDRDNEPAAPYDSVSSEGRPYPTELQIWDAVVDLLVEAPASLDLVVVGSDCLVASQQLHNSAVMRHLSPGCAVLIVGDTSTHAQKGSFVGPFDLPGPSLTVAGAFQLSFPKGVPDTDIEKVTSAEFKANLAAYEVRVLREGITRRSDALADAAAQLKSRDAVIEHLEWEIESRAAALATLTRRLDEVSQVRDQSQLPIRAQVKLLMSSVPRSVRARARRVRRPRKPAIESSNSGDSGRKRGDSTRDALGRSNISLGEILLNLFPERFRSERAEIDRAVESGEDLLGEQSDPAGRGELTSSTPIASGRLHADQSVRSVNINELSEVGPIDLYTVDIWDTLIERRRPADAAKTATARRMILMPAILPGARRKNVFQVAKLRVQVEAQLAREHPYEEYEIIDVLERILTALGHKSTSGRRELAQELANLEIEDEISWSLPRADVLRLMDSWPADALLLSDFYMSGESLSRIVEEVTGADLTVISSVDIGRSKRLNGDLFEVIREEHNVAADRHLHVGDNAHSDVKCQVQTGGVALHIPANTSFPSPGTFSAADLSSCWRELEKRLAEDALGREDSVYRSAARTAAPLAVCLVAAGIEQAISLGSDRVHYISREGALLAQIHKAIEPILRPPIGERVAPIHLAVSRRATFAASLVEPFTADLGRLWSMYPRQSVAAFLTSLGLDPESLRELLSSSGLTPDTILQDAADDSRVRRLLESSEFLDLLRAHVAESRTLLREYLQSVTDPVGPMIMIDIGWRGSIQDNIVRALGIQPTIGIYLGLFPFLNRQPRGATKRAVAFNGNYGDEYSFASPPAALERPWTPDIPSTIGYRREGSAVKPMHEVEAGAVSVGIQEFQEETLAVAPIVAEWLVGMGLTTEVLHRDLGRLAERLWREPPTGIANIWFDSAHDDTFGAMDNSVYGKSRPGPDWYSGPLRRHLEAGEKISAWPAGYRSWQPVKNVLKYARAWKESR